METQKICPDIIITRKTPVPTILFYVAEKGQTLNELYLRYIPIKGRLKENEYNPTDVCNLALQYLSNSFGWFEVQGERRLIMQEFETTNPLGVKTTYKANVWVIPIAKHGALRKGRE